MTASTPQPRRGPASARQRLWAALALGLAIAATFAAAALLAPTGGAQATVQIDAERAAIRALEEELVQIDDAAGAAADAAATARGRVAELKAAIRANTADLKAARAAHAVAQDQLADRLRALYVERAPSFAEILVSSGSLSGAVDTHETLDLVRQQDQALVSGIEESQAALAAARRGLTAARERSRREAEEATRQLAELERLQGARRAILGQARTRLEGLIVEEQARQERLAALARAQREAEAAFRARAAAPSTAPSAAGTPSPAGATSGGGPAPTGAPVSAGAVAPAPAPAPAPSGSPPEGHLERIAQCESGGNPRAVSPGGQYRGKYQFHPDTWAAVGGSGDPAAAPEAEQDLRAGALYGQRGASPWPICGA